jgi:hypothetical protein
MPTPMTHRQRILAALHGEPTDHVPFTIYEWKIPWGYDKRKLIERGLGMLRRFAGWRAEYPHCEWRMQTYYQDGVKYEREFWRTPKGEVTALFMPDQTCNVRKQVEFWIKGEADYEPLIYWALDAVLSPAYEEIKAGNEDLGDDGLVFVWAGYSPLQQIILQLAGIEQFCFELADRPEWVWALYDALLERDRRKYPIIAAAPVEVIQCCANPIAQVLGHKLFIEKVLPCLDECAALIHAAGKFQSIHVDGDNALWAKDLASSSVDIIEAFTPAPDTDMTLVQGCDVFHDKIVWANFPSSLHLASAEAIRAATVELLRSAASHPRFLLGITEDVPTSRWRISLSAIMDGLSTFG